jgi:hypothetical protein
MPAYVIFIRERTLDQSELDAYAQAAPPSLEGWPIKFPGCLWSPGRARGTEARGCGDRRVSVIGRRPAMVRQPGVPNCCAA